MTNMQKKLYWYAENQQFVDKDTQKLREKEERIVQLEDQLSQLQHEVWIYHKNNIIDQSTSTVKNKNEELLNCKHTFSKKSIMLPKS